MTHLTSSVSCVWAQHSPCSCFSSHGAGWWDETLINVTPSTLGLIPLHSTNKTGEEAVVTLENCHHIEQEKHHVESVWILQSHTSCWISLLPCTLQVGFNTSTQMLSLFSCNLLEVVVLCFEVSFEVFCAGSKFSVFMFGNTIVIYFLFFGLLAWWVWMDIKTGSSSKGPNWFVWHVVWNKSRKQVLPVQKNSRRQKKVDRGAFFSHTCSLINTPLGKKSSLLAVLCLNKWL